MGTRKKGVIWLHQQLQPPSSPLKIAQDKMLSWSQHPPGKGGGNTGSREGIEVPLRKGNQEPGSKTCLQEESGTPSFSFPTKVTYLCYYPFSSSFSGSSQNPQPHPLPN